MSFAKGDTPPKKLVRYETWATAQDHNPKSWSTAPKICLSGPDGGDVSVALGLGVPATNIVAVDRDKHAVSSAQFRFPDVKMQCCDVLKAVEQHRKTCDFIFLDFCAQLQDSLIDTMALSAVEGLLNGGLLAVCFLAGREQENQGSISQRVVKMRQRMKGQHAEEVLPYLARFTILHDELISRTRKHGGVLLPVSAFFYKSKHSYEPKGMPMCVYVAQFVRCSRLSVESEVRKALALTPTMQFVDPTSRELGEKAIKLQDAGMSPELLFDVSSGTIAAWKAHATRRVYATAHTA